MMHGKERIPVSGSPLQTLAGRYFAVMKSGYSRISPTGAHLTGMKISVRHFDWSGSAPGSVT